jgi:hypothetical protein
MSESVEKPAANFRRFGFVVDRVAVTGQELAGLQAETAAMIAADRRKPPGDFQVRDGRPWRIDFPSDPSRQELNDSIWIVTAHPGITSVMSAIIGSSQQRLPVRDPGVSDPSRRQRSGRQTDDRYGRHGSGSS